jgi:hypothetical protein
VTQVEGSSRRAVGLERVEGDQRLKTPLLEYGSLITLSQVVSRIADKRNKATSNKVWGSCCSENLAKLRMNSDSGSRLSSTTKICMRNVCCLEEINECINRKSTHRFIHKITKIRSQIRPDEKGGGILADEMGMGKTLSILALLLKTLDNARQWALDKKDSEFTQTRIQSHSRATLVIVPSGRKSSHGVYGPLLELD